MPWGIPSRGIYYHRESSHNKTSSSPRVAATSQRYRLQLTSKSCISLVASTWDIHPVMKLIPLSSQCQNGGCEPGGYAMPRGVNHRWPNPLSELSDLFLVGYPVASSTKSARVHFTIRLLSFFFFFQALEVAIYGVASPLQIRNQYRAQNRCCWELSPSEHREWMEIWYVGDMVCGDFDIQLNFVTTTTFADSCDLTQALS